MQVVIELPDDVAAGMGGTSDEIGRSVLKAFVADSYRSGKLTGVQARQLLGLESRFELDTFLKDAGVYREYSAEELERDFQNSRRASDPFTSSL